MKSLWDEQKAKGLDEIGLRVYSSNLLGSDESLVLHGGGNTSYKDDKVLYVKGSGWDLKTIKKEGFAPVRLSALRDLAKKESLSDTQMVKAQKEAMLDKDAPNPSVEAILHSIIPYKFVDHTHSDAIVTISNSINGTKIIKDLFKNYLILPYIMPGFILAKDVYEKTKEISWDKLEGIILLNHGIFTFSDSAKTSYEKMINSVSRAEEFLDKNAPLNLSKDIKGIKIDKKSLDKLKGIISLKKGYRATLVSNTSPLAIFYSKQRDLEDFVTRGVLTPEHILRTKRAPLVLKDLTDIEKKVEEYIKEYKNYFNQFATNQTMLNPAPNYIVIKDFGVICIGKDEKEANIINDIINHTMQAVLRADKLGGYKSISLKDSFDIEYWELEQAKLRK